MQTWMIAMACVLSSAEVPVSPAAAATAWSSDLETGSLLFSDGKCLAVKVVSRSRFTHVAVVVREKEGVFVYDSQNGVGVRRLSLAEYLGQNVGVEIEILRPRGSLTSSQKVGLQRYLKSQLGRPYAILHHLTGSRREGLHCAEYLTDALMAIELISAEQPSRVSPASLHSALLTHKLYRHQRTARLDLPEPKRVEGKNWCHELWYETKDCCSSCWSGFRGCVLCQ